MLDNKLQAFLEIKEKEESLIHRMNLITEQANETLAPLKAQLEELAIEKEGIGEAILKDEYFNDPEHKSYRFGDKTIIKNVRKTLKIVDELQVMKELLDNKKIQKRLALLMNIKPAEVKDQAIVIQLNKKFAKPAVETLANVDGMLLSGSEFVTTEYLSVKDNE